MFLNRLLCSFREVHLNQHALFRLLQRWQQDLDIAGVMDGF